MISIPSDSHTSDSVHRNLVTAVFLIALAARLATIWCGTNVDEGVYWAEALQIREGHLIYQDTQFNKTPLVALVGACFFVFGDTPIIPMRVAMILASLLGLWAIYRLAKELFGPNAGLAALILIALEPYSCVWAKYLHTSSWAPWFEAGIFWLLISGLRRNDLWRLAASGVLLGIFALSKQSAIYVLPSALAAWFLFVPDRRIKTFLVHTSIWGGSAALILAPLFLFFALCGALDAMWFDIWTAHHLMAPWFSHHTLSFKWQELRSMVHLAPVLWLMPFASVILLRTGERKAIVFLWIWWIVELLGNCFLFTHIWRHYFLVCMVPAAILGGAFWRRVVDLGKDLLKSRPSTAFGGSLLVLALAMVIFWPRNDWFYPGLSLQDEKKLAAYVERSCPQPYLLNLTNPALYVWTGKQIPPARRDGHATRIPFFMTIAGRGYMDVEDMQNTVDAWRSLPIGCVVAYDKYVKQILNDPLMEPLQTWLSDEFKEPRRVAVGQTYYGWFFLFDRKEQS